MHLLRDTLGGLRVSGSKCSGAVSTRCTGSRAPAPTATRLAATSKVVLRSGHECKPLIGGVRFETSLPTLTSVPNTYLGAVFSGRHPLVPDPDGWAYTRSITL